MNNSNAERSNHKRPKRRFSSIHPSFVDVAFILAVLFLLPAMLAKENGLADSPTTSLLLPNANPVTNESNYHADTITIRLQLYRNGNLFLDGQPFTDLSWEESLHHSSSLLIEAETGTSFDLVLERLAQARQYGIQHISFVYQPTP